MPRCGAWRRRSSSWTPRARSPPSLPRRTGSRTGFDFSLRARVTLPALPDGDYKLRARVTTPLGTGTVEAPLGLYAPARVHVLTDRPLYEPGHQVRFRAVVLRAKDLAPIDGRPGTWFITDPSGEVVLEQRVTGGPLGRGGRGLPARPRRTHRQMDGALDER